MNRVVVNSRVGPDGVLHLDVPVGPADADREVQVTIEPKEPRPEQQSHADWLRGIAGTWQGDFQRPPQGTIEQREPLS